MKLKITLQSFLLTGSGEGSVLIDTDVVFHKNGFPCIPARRIKGMLRENMIEVLEMEGKKGNEIGRIINLLFGETGAERNSGKLYFENFYVEGWKEIQKALEQEQKNYPFVFQPSNVSKYYTTEIQQTALEDGKADVGSLRNYRVIKPYLENSGQMVFEADIELKHLKKEEIDYLEKATLHFRYAGTRRNRGFGKIKCQLIDSEISATNATPVTIKGGEVVVKITTNSPVILSLQLGEKNTVFTEKYITGNRLRGLLAQQYIQNHLTLNFKNAHTDPGFREIFLSGRVTFGHLYLQNTEPIPLHLHKYKSRNENDLIDVFQKDDDEINKNEITKPFGGLGNYTTGIVESKEPATSFYFHNSRPDRAAGRSIEEQDEGGIFYYEAIDEGQLFEGMIKGPNGLIVSLFGIIKENNQLKLGRSRSAQYGEIEINFATPEVNTTQDVKNAGGEIVTRINNNKYLMILQSPLLLLNEFGEAEASIGFLEKLLLKDFKIAITIEKAATSFTIVEQYNGAWNSKSAKMPAFKEGSVFLLDNISSDGYNTLSGIQKSGLGIWKEQGYGQVKIIPYPGEIDFKAIAHDTGLVEGLPGKLSSPLPDKSNSTDDPPPGNPVLKAIFQLYNEETIRTEVKTDAVMEAEKPKYLYLKNHLISRMERMIGSKASEVDIHSWIKEIIGKPAGESLKKVNLLDSNDLYLFKKSGEESFELNQLYWLTFFRILRKLKQLKEQPNG